MKRKRHTPEQIIAKLREATEVQALNPGCYRVAGARSAGSFARNREASAGRPMRS